MLVIYSPQEEELVFGLKQMLVLPANFSKSKAVQSDWNDIFILVILSLSPSSWVVKIRVACFAF